MLSGYFDRARSYDEMLPPEEYVSANHLMHITHMLLDLVSVCRRGLSQLSASGEGCEVA